MLELPAVKDDEHSPMQGMSVKCYAPARSGRQSPPFWLKAASRGLAGLHRQATLWTNHGHAAALCAGSFKLRTARARLGSRKTGNNLQHQN